VDGVLTDGRITYDGAGRELKWFSVRDGFGVRRLIREGIKVAIISGRSAEVVDIRARELGISETRQGVDDKIAVYRELLAQWDIREKESAYVADDIPDIPVFLRVGLAVAVADACPEIIRRAHLVTRRNGGFGAVREAAEVILRAQGKWASE
jgi:3-deoxy-D-manno-octulosonate 8-phosphate phosphatase (KDO 8-P phosphatase)